MTIKAKLGLVSGTRDAPSQLVTVFDSTDSALDYQVALETAVAAAPSSILAATPDITGIQVEERKNSAIRFSIPYNRRGQSILLRNVNTQVKAKKIYHFITAGSVYGTSGVDNSTSYSSTKWKLDRQTNPTEFNSGKPLSVDPLTESRTITYKTRRSLMTDSYLDAVEAMVTTGAFNNAIYWGRVANTLQLVSFRVTEREDGDWELSYGFGYQPQQINVDVGDGIQIPTLRGIDGYWPIEKEVYADGNIQPRTVGVVVGQVWPNADFSALKLPWQGSLTTRTSPSAGVITTFYNHDITGGDPVYIFWNGGYMLASCASHTSTSITFSSGVGDALPLANTNLCATKST